MKELLFHRLLLPTVESHASAPAVVDGDTGRAVTFGEHLDRVGRLASALRVHRIIQAVELSVLILLAAIADAVAGNLTATRVLTVAALAVGVLMTVAHLLAIVEARCRAAGMPTPELVVEPGRAIAGPGTITLYEVGTIKEVTVAASTQRRYISVDGGMSDNVRTALYDATYDCRLVSRYSEAPAALSRVVGKHCESGDVVVRDCWLPDDLAPGDLLAVAGTGAYCYSMSSRYNLLPRPAVVAVRESTHRLLLRRETMADLLSLEIS